MPSELRRITFRGREVVKAIVEYHRRRNLPLPPGNVLGVRVADEPTVHATLHIVADAAGTTDLAIGGEVLAASLILYCIDRRIPLPVESEKRLQKVNDEDIALFVIKRDR